MLNTKPDTNGEVDDLIRRSTHADVPIEVEERLRRRIAEFQTKIEQRPPSPLRSLVYSLMRPPVFRVAAMVAVAVLVALVLLPIGPQSGRAYAQAVAQFKAAHSLQYKLVLAPYTEVDFSYLAPRYRRVNCSWGIEIRTDNAGRQIVLLHATRQYAMEEGTPTDTLANAMDLVDQLRALPRTADETLGEQQVGEKRLTGYRLRHMPPIAMIGNLKEMDLWVDGRTGRPDHVDITIQEAGKPLHKMQIKDIRLNGTVDPSQFTTTPPAGYSAIPIPGEKHGVQAAERPVALRPEIKQAEALTAVVVRMKGSFLQAGAVVGAVESHLKEMGVTPAGPAFGRFGSEQDWDAGYPVPSGTRVVKAPFQTVTLPATTVASATVPGAWGQDSGSRWATFLKWVVEHGYVPAGPPMEFWSGEARTQSTEMRLAVRKAN
jgi:outer membrane lipoprotein-sorting protein